ncbi:MAG: tRNA pseudouridine(55) synthase TruB [Gammaproteobacteria bacterium]|nr:tRNA pseudouridine(55) synthase TruB [Gammaproteobacteria bacterium]
MARKKKGRSVNGILVLDKPSGITSNKALQKVKHLFNAQKAGHTGSLDPLATGVLPICLGEATKVSHYLLDSNKSYRAKCILGSVTTTGDSDGEVIEQKPVPIYKQADLLTLLSTFEGDINQTPPMFSALKHNGRPLYEYARKGIVIERKSRPITIFSIQLKNFSLNDEVNTLDFIEIDVHCSKGTYIRTLCEDIGKKMGCGAHISELRRLESGPFLLSQAITMDYLFEQYGLDESVQDRMEPSLYNQMDQLLLPTDTAIKQFPAIELNELEFDRIQHGMTIDRQPEIESQDYRLYYDNKLIGLAILDEEQQLKPKRLLFL